MVFPDKNLLKILVADDDLGIRASLTELLACAGYTRVTTACDGADALQKIEAEDFDILITDWEMPRLKGDRLMAAAKKLRPDILIILMSGALDPFMVQKAYELGARASFSKPLAVRKIMAEVEAIYRETIVNESYARCQGTIMVLVDAFETIGAFTKGHSNLVAELAVEMALALRMSLRRMLRVRLAGLGHDVGMVKIDPHIWTKPGILTEEEFNFIKQHPLYSAELLSDCLLDKNMDKPIIGHHENLDGSGYPRGLHRDEIPTEAQIISLADAYIAMLSPRPYRQARQVEEVVEIIKEERGRRWEPGIVDLFLQRHVTN